MIKQSDNRKRGRASRNKGARGERELAGIIRDNWGYPVHRGHTFYGESDVVGLNGIHVECKRREKMNIYQAMEQAIAESKKRGDGIPTVFFRSDGKPWLVIQLLPDWMDLYGAWEENDGE